MLRFFAPVLPGTGRLNVEPAGWFGFAMRAASGSMTSIDAVRAWPWHKMLFVWREAQAMHEESWGLLLEVWYRRKGDG